MINIVPYSNEKAETLGEVIVTRCSSIEKKVVSLGVALYGGSKVEMQKEVSEALREREKKLIAEIVSFRAEVTKKIAEQNAKSQKSVETYKPAGSSQ